MLIALHLFTELEILPQPETNSLLSKIPPQKKIQITGVSRFEHNAFTKTHRDMKHVCHPGCTFKLSLLFVHSENPLYFGSLSASSPAIFFESQHFRIKKKHHFPLAFRWGNSAEGRHGPFGHDPLVLKPNESTGFCFSLPSEPSCRGRFVTKLDFLRSLLMGQKLGDHQRLIGIVDWYFKVLFLRYC